MKVVKNGKISWLIAIIICDGPFTKKIYILLLVLVLFYNPFLMN